MEPHMQHRSAFVAALVTVLGCGAGRAPAAPPECDQGCKDAIALRTVRVAMRFAYNLVLQSNPVGMQDEIAPCIPTGSVHIVGEGTSNAMLGTTDVDLTYTFTDCVNPAPQNPTPERNYRLTVNGVVTEKGTLAMGGPTTALMLHGTEMGFSGTVYDPPVPYEETKCELVARQEGNNVTGDLCGRMTDGFSGF
jgi:hypothetical protein